MSIPYTTNVRMLDAVTVDTTSQAFDVSKRQQITIQLICANHTSGNGVFTVDATNDDVANNNWVTGISFRDAKATASTTWVVSETLSANGNAGIYVPGGWRFIRVVLDVTTDGTYTAIMENGG
ncbi:MAG: hypothetical protein V4436_02250 [Patescibacteria group bacterium]